MNAPRQAAVIIPLRETDGILEVYLAERSPTLSFLGGFHSFPGGTLDEEDTDLADAGWVESAHVSAAQRELFEELGIFLHAPELSPPERAELRARVLADSKAWNSWVEQRGGLFEVPVIPMGRWVTPPFATKQYDALYFAAFVQDRAPIELDLRENCDGLWISPALAVEQHNRGELLISFPVLETLKVIAKHDGNVEKASEELRQRTGSYQHEGGEMIAGLHIVPVRTPTLPPATHTNCYLLGRDELVVVDPATPYPDEQERLLTYIRHLLANGKTLREIWLTHHHPDHVGAADRIRETFGIAIAAHALTAELLQGSVEIDRFIQDGEQTTLNGDTTHDRWVAFHTPGHARGHLVFYEQTRGTLVSGDLVVSTGTVIVAAPDGNMSDYFASLHRMRELPKHGMLFPAHGPPVANALQKVDEYIEHRTQREASIWHALDRPRDAAEVVASVYTDVPKAVWGLAQANVESHLVKLERDGRVRRDGSHWYRSSDWSPSDDRQ